MVKKKNMKIMDEYMEDLADLYIRVSTTEQAKEGYSVEEQENRLRKYCEAMGIKIHKVYIDPGFSGASLNRPGIQAVISDVQSRVVKKVIVWKLDRLSRSQKDTLIMLEDIFLSNGCDFVSMLESFDTSTPFGRAIVGILAAFAQLERENIKERTAMGRAARIAKGHYSGSHAPLGYSFAPGCNDLIVNEYESAIVQDIYVRFLSGESLKHISECMLAKFGGAVRKWNSTMIRRILSNQIYIGRVRHSDETFEGLHDPIVSETEFFMASSILEHNREIKKQCARSESLLTGLLYCGDCGARMQQRRVARGYSLRRYICYSVSRTSKPMIRSDKCSNRLHPFTMEELDELIKNEIAKLATDEEYLQSIIRQDAPHKADDSQLLQDRLSEVKKQTDKLLNLYQVGAVDFQDIQERLASLKEEKEALHRSIDRATADASIPVDMVRSQAATFKAAIDSGDDETVSQILRILIDKIVVLNDDIEIYWSFC